MEKRIAFISDHASPLATLGDVDSGGQNVYVAEVARNLTDLGYSVDIYTRRDHPEIPEIVDFIDHVRVIHISAGPQKALPKEDLFGYMKEFVDEMSHFIKRNAMEYALIHAHFWLSGLVACEIKKRFEIPFIITFHALGAVRRFHQGDADRFPAIREDVEQEIMDEATFIVAECPNDYKDLNQYYRVDNRKIKIIPCGYNPLEFYPLGKRLVTKKLGLSPDYKYLLHVGRIVPRKGIDTIIEAFAKVHEQLPEYQLLVVGGNNDDDDPEMLRLKQLSADNKINEKVIFTGKKSRDELKYYYSCAELFMTTPWYEPFGITPLEAMACGTPVLGSDVGGIAYTVQNGISGALVPPKNPTLLAEKIVELVDSGQLKELGDSAIQYVAENFTWKQVAQQMDCLYTEVMGSAQKHQDVQELKLAFHQASQAFLLSSEELSDHLISASKEIADAISQGAKILVCGNGGSAAEAQHFVAELVGRFEISNRRAYPVICLNADTAVITAWANDFGYEYIFKRQVEALGNPSDILITLSTSGHSANIIHALNEAKTRGMKTINLLGKDGGEAVKLGDINLVVPSASTGRIQEVHLHLIHQMCRLVENKLSVLSKQDIKIVKKLIA